MITGRTDDETARRLSESLPWLGLCLDWLAQERPWTPETEAVADGVAAKKVEYETSDPTPCRFESHLREVDVQVVIDGIEWIDVARPEDLGAPVEEDAGSDLVFYADALPTVPVARLPLAAGRFAVFFPEDAHRCGASVGAGGPLRKLVFKVDRSTFGL